MKWYILPLILLVSIVSRGTFATEDTRASKKCNKPFGKIGEIIMDPDCGQSVCRKEGHKPKWKKCPRAATEQYMKTELDAKLGKIEQLIKEQTAATEVSDAKLGKIEQMIREQTEKIERQIVEVCGTTATTQVGAITNQIGCWIQFPGTLTQVAVGQYGVWGVGYDDTIWEKTSNDWTKIDVGVGLKVISVGENTVWGVARDQTIWMRIGGANVWTGIPGKLNQVSVSAYDDSVVWGVFNKRIYRWTGSAMENIGGELDVVSCGESGVWGVNHEDEPWYRTGTYGGVASVGTGWIQVDGYLKWISSGVAGQVWGIDKDKNVFKREGISTDNPIGTAWKKVPGCGTSLAQLSIWAGQAWGVSIDQEVFYAAVQDSSED